MHATERKCSRSVRLFVLSVGFSPLWSVRLFVRLARLPRGGDGCVALGTATPLEGGVGVPGPPSCIL